MAELGETNDPRQLVPGNPAAVGAAAKALRSKADSLEQAGVGLKRIDTVDGWSGPAGDAFRAKFQGQPGSWLQAADSFYTAANALDNYATTLTWAQGQAAESDITVERRTERNPASTDAVSAVQAAGRHRSIPQDAGETGRASARNLLNTARGDLTDAGDEVARVIGAERNKAPEKPSFWSQG